MIRTFAISVKDILDPEKRKGWDEQGCEFERNLEAAQRTRKDQYHVQQVVTSSDGVLILSFSVAKIVGGAPRRLDPVEFDKAVAEEREIREASAKGRPAPAPSSGPGPRIL